MFHNLTVRNKLFIIVGAVAVLFGSTVYGLGLVAQRHVVNTLQTEVSRSKEVIAEYFDSRYRQLDAGLRSLVDSPEIRAVLTTDGIDHDTQLMSITDLQHMLGADVILYCNPEGRTLARTDDPFDEESMVDGISIIGGALEGELTRGFWDLEDQSFLAIAFPVIIDEEVLGVVCAGVDIASDASQIKSLLLQDVIVARNGKLLTSSYEIEESDKDAATKLAAGGTVSLHSIADVNALPKLSREDADASLATAIQIAPAEGFVLNAAVMVPEETVFGFYRDFKNVLLWMGLITVGLSLVITFKIGSIISNQVQSTLNALERVAQGDLSSRLDISSRDEFGRIAKALNTAISASADTLDALAVRNRDTKMLLDAVEQGFFTVDVNGVMSEERSGAVERTFGTVAPRMKFVDFISQFDPKAASWIELGLEDVFLDIMPVEVILDQMPSRFRDGDKIYSIQYGPVRTQQTVSNISVVISDITALVENEKLESGQREMMAMVHRMAEDRKGFLNFINESNDIVESLKANLEEDLVLTKRRVHTLKGNTSIYGLMRVAEICHRIEDFIAENVELPEIAVWDELFASWEMVDKNLNQITGEREQGIEITPQEYDSFMASIFDGCSHDELAIRAASWQLEPTKNRLERIKDQAEGLAARLGKGTVDVSLESNGLKLDNEHWSEFWSSFIHVVRNAVDHGIETAEERTELGKPETGSISVTTFVKNEEFILQLSDDGRGINWDKVTEAAYKKGLPAECHDDLVDALFEDGLSTASAVTDTSGRGVGMSAVKAACDSLGGRISVDSKQRKGTTFSFAFPVASMAPETVKDLLGNDVSNAQHVALCY